MDKNFIAKGADFSTLDKHVSAPLFRKVFQVNKPKNCTINICGLGFYELYINGVNVTKGKLAPYIFNPDDVLYYDSYDITDKLVQGENCIVVILGNGFINSAAGQFWDFDKATFRSAPKLAMSTTVDGEELFCADSSFKVIDSSITFDDLRAGERYDARIDLKEAFYVGYDDSSWENAIPADSPKGEFRLCDINPIRKEKELSPVCIHKSKKGGFIYDFGEINAGICRLKINGERGQQVSLRHGEMLIDGELDIANISFANVTLADYQQHDMYICSGLGEEVFEPRFTYHGFRYVWVEGITDAQATEDLLTFEVLHSDFNTVGKFFCDDLTINKLQEITLRSDTSNFYYFPTDCPQREKNGWTADAALSSEQLLLNFDCAKDLREWLYNVRKSQRSTGELPAIVPTSGWGFAWGNGPAWDAVIFEVPFQLYRYTGNKEIILENADAMYLYLQYMKGHVKPTGLIEYGLGDWCQTNQPHEWIYTTPSELTDTLTGMRICSQTQFMFGEIGAEKEKEFASSMHEQFRTAFRKAYLNDDLFINGKTQTAQAMALSNGVFNQNEYQKGFERLIELIEQADNHFDCGVLGAKVIFHVLAENGYQDLAYKLITQDTYPSYGYLLKKGATTLWEHMTEFVEESNDYIRKDGNLVVSLNHHFFGEISAWFYKKLSGINLERGREVTVCPCPVKNIKKVSAEYKNSVGNIKVDLLNENSKIIFKINSKGFDVKVESPSGYKVEKKKANEYVLIPC